MFLSGKTILITGATGRLGSETVYRLEELGAHVLPLVLEGYPIEPKQRGWKARSSPIPIFSPEALERVATPDYVIHFHWRVDRSLSFTKQLVHEIDSNLNRLEFFWDWMKRKAIERLINVSSIKVFSHLNKNPISAETEPSPVTPYGMAKLTAERFLDAYFGDSSFPIIHLRLCSVTSVDEHPSTLLSQLCDSAWSQRRIQIYLGHTVHLMDIDEAVDLTINAALQAKKGRYIVAPKGVKTEEIVFLFERISKRRVNAEYVNSIGKGETAVFETNIEGFRGDWTRSVSLPALLKKKIASWGQTGPIALDEGITRGGEGARHLEEIKEEG
jgi:UDP-glucose 4-epimerase